LIYATNGVSLSTYFGRYIESGLNFGRDFLKINLFRTWAFIAVCRQHSDNDSENSKVISTRKTIKFKYDVTIIFAELAVVIGAHNFRTKLLKL